MYFFLFNRTTLQVFYYIRCRCSIRAPFVILQTSTRQVVKTPTVISNNPVQSVLCLCVRVCVCACVRACACGWVLKPNYLAQRLCNLYKSQLTSKYVIPVLPLTGNRSTAVFIICYTASQQDNHSIIYTLLTIKLQGSTSFMAILTFYLYQDEGNQELFITARSPTRVRAGSKDCMRF